MKPNVQSFDVFDTLLARKVKNPTDIFAIIEATFPFPNFKEYRCKAESCSLNMTYEQFESMFQVPTEICNALKEFEIETELKYSYLIQTNCARVRDGDILVSDMYLSPETIMRLLRENGFQKQVNLYVSPGGKRSGQIWPLLKEHYTITLHLGDNEHSDVKTALDAGVPAELTTVHQIHPIEEFFLHSGLLFREFRHQNPYPVGTNNYELYNDQAIFNIPLLILVSHELYKIMTAESRTRLLLLTRDGCLLRRIFPLLYPNVDCLELQSSRFIHQTANQEYKDYLKTMVTETSLIFDLFGTFSSGKPLYKEVFGHYPRVHLLGYNSDFGDSGKYPGLTWSSNLCFEEFNLDVVGPLIKLEGAFIRAPILDYELEDARIYSDTVDSFCSFFAEKRFPSLTRFELSDFLEKFGNRKPHVRKISHETTKISHLPTMYFLLPIIAKTLGYDTKYMSQYETLLAPWYNKPCSILDLRETPCLDVWRLYMRTSTAYGACDLRTQYDVIIIDNKNNSLEMLLWPFLNPGGIYCIESPTRLTIFPQAR